MDFLVEQGVLKSCKLVEAFRRVPRHLFIVEGSQKMAYIDMPFPIAENSTISQPSTVAMMLEFLNLEEGNKVLEIGTGSGWNAALIGYCIGKKGKVITLEIERKLAKQAGENLIKAGISNVEVLNKDGSEGYKEKAPYDRIIYTAAIERVPESVLAQLNMGGILIAPIGGPYVQVLIRFKKEEKGKFDRAELGYFNFVPIKSSVK